MSLPYPVPDQTFPLQAPAPGVRAGDADRDAAAAALGEHFARGRLTLDELNARLDATLTATTHGELSQATRDLPDAPARLRLMVPLAAGRSISVPERPGTRPEIPGQRSYGPAAQLVAMPSAEISRRGIFDGESPMGNSFPS